MLDSPVTRAEQVSDFRGNHRHRERFGDIIVRTYLQSFQLLFQIRFGGQYDDRYMTGAQVLLNLFAQLQAVHNGHHDIRKNQVRLLLLHERQCFLSVTRFRYVVTFSQLITQISTNIEIVFYDEYLFFPCPVTLCRFFFYYFFFIFRVNDVHILIVGGVHLLFPDGVCPGCYFFQSICRFFCR